MADLLHVNDVWQADSAVSSSAQAPEATPVAFASQDSAPSSPSSVPATASEDVKGNGAASAGTPSDSGRGGAAAAAAESNTPVQDSMRRKLTEALQPVSLYIMDESSQHAGHVGSRMKAGYSGETHFKVELVSAAFEGLKTIKRHRMVYDVRTRIP